MGNISSCYKRSKPEMTKMDPCTPPIDNQSTKSNASYSAQAEDAGQPEDVSLSMDSPSTPNNPIAKKQTVSSPLLSVRRTGGRYDDSEAWWKWRLRRFSAIGYVNSFLLLLVFFLSSAWSLLLIILNLEPSKSANYLLQTESLDNGHFWQSRKAASSVLVTTTALLTILIFSYWYLLYLLLVRPPSSRIVSDEVKPKQQRSAIRKLPTVEKRSSLLIVRRVVRTIVLVYRNVVSTDGKYRKIWNILMEIPEIILQILSLREYMAQGLDASLLFCYASLMATNAFVTFYHIQFRWNETTLGHILKDSIIDAAFAVFFPALILLYSLFVFQDDLKAVKIRQQFFPPREFERKARNLINAKEMNLFSTDFESLLVRSAWDVFLKLTFSLLACLRWNKITLLLLEREHKQPTKHTAKTMGNCKTVAPAEFSPGIERFKPLRSQLRTIVGCCFLIYGVGCLVYTTLAVRGSKAACSFYPSCVQFASQWTPNGPNDACECLAYVDRDLAPADPTNRTDVTDALAQLAAAGKLQTVQLVNRKINGSLPEELQTCRSLRNLVLIHTGVQEFPSWTATSFANLEYLHIEGDSSDTNLVELPSDLFTLMANLHTIHVSYHANLPNLPSLTGLKTLESVYFGYLDSIKEIPSTGDLPEIQVLALEALPLVRSLPDIAQYQSTLEMVFLQDVSICCSGFLSEGNCNTTFPTCCGEDFSSSSSSDDGSSHDLLPPTCLELPRDSNVLPSNATLSLLDKFAANISNFCDVDQAACPSVRMSTKKLQDNVCQGVLYRACSSESKGVGICFNEDMGPVECKYSPKIIEMRKAEIAAGCRCNKVEEQWLGCTG